MIREYSTTFYYMKCDGEDCGECFGSNMEYNSRYELYDSLLNSDWANPQEHISISAGHISDEWYCPECSKK